MAPSWNCNMVITMEDTYKKRMEQKKKMQEKADCMLKESGARMGRADKAFIQTFASKKDQMPSQTADISKEKAKKMLKDGTAHGKPLTEKQKGMLGAIIGS